MRESVEKNLPAFSVSLSDCVICQDVVIEEDVDLKEAIVCAGQTVSSKSKFSQFRISQVKSNLGFCLCLAKMKNDVINAGGQYIEIE